MNKAKKKQKKQRNNEARSQTSYPVVQKFAKSKKAVAIKWTRKEVFHMGKTPMKKTKEIKLKVFRNRLNNFLRNDRRQLNNQGVKGQKE